MPDVKTAEQLAAEKSAADAEAARIKAEEELRKKEQEGKSVPVAEYERLQTLLKQAENTVAAANKKLKEIEDAKLSDTERLTKRVTELEPNEKRVKDLEEQIATLLAQEVAAVPADKRSAIPDLPPEKQLNWIRARRAEGFFGPAAVPGTATVQAGAAGDTRITLSKIKEWKRTGKYLEHKAEIDAAQAAGQIALE